MSENGPHKGKSTQGTLPVLMIAVAFILTAVLFTGCIDGGREDANTAPEAVIEMPKASFAISEDVEFMVVNTGNTTLSTVRPFGVDVYDTVNDTWEPVELDLVFTAELIYLEPGQSLSQSFTPDEAFVGDREEGRYRITKELTDPSGDNIEIMKEFVIGAVSEGNASAAVINLPQETYAASDTIRFEVRNTGDTQLYVGRPFSIERYDEDTGEWDTVDLDLAWTLELIILEPGQSLEQAFVPEDAFAEGVEEGQYRVVKDMSIADTGESLLLEGVFRIE